MNIDQVTPIINDLKDKGILSSDQILVVHERLILLKANLNQDPELFELLDFQNIKYRYYLQNERATSCDVFIFIDLNSDIKWFQILIKVDLWKLKILTMTTFKIS